MTDALSLDTIATQLEEAKADLALAQRIQTAPDRVKTLTPLYEKALRAYESAKAKMQANDAALRAAAEKALADARFAGLSDLCIEERVDIKNPHVLKNTYVISWTHPVWGAEENETLPAPCTAKGFGFLPPDVLAWIIERHPEKVPASIMDLAPGDVEAALTRYFIALRRGYLAS